MLAKGDFAYMQERGNSNENSKKDGKAFKPSSRELTAERKERDKRDKRRTREQTESENGLNERSASEETMK